MSYKSRCLIFSHRGASLEAPENTFCAFDKSLVYGVDGMETDVQLSRDGIAVLWHDRFLDRINMPSKRVADFDFEELIAIQFSGPFAKGKTNAHIVGLEEFVKKYQGRTQLLLEVKNRDWDADTGRHELKMRQCVDLANRYLPSDSRFGVMISSFNFDSLAYAQQYSNQWPLIYNSEELKKPEQVDQFFRRSGFISGLCMPIENLHEDIVAATRRCDKTIATYTCNTDNEILKGLDLGIDILITDNPRRALKLRGQ